MDTFVCRRCGGCCRPRGYVRLRTGEADAIAAYLGMTVHEFTEQYTRLTDDRSGLSLIEAADGACVFLLETQACRIQEMKPAQCREFPLRWNFSGWERICEAEAARRKYNES